MLPRSPYTAKSSSLQERKPTRMPETFDTKTNSIILSSSKNAVPVPLLEELVNRNLSTYDVQTALDFYRMIRGSKAYEWVSSQDLLDRTPLKDQWVSIWIADWEDSEWKMLRFSGATKLEKNSKESMEDTPHTFDDKQFIEFTCVSYDVFVDTYHEKYDGDESDIRYAYEDYCADMAYRVELNDDKSILLTTF